MIDISVDLETWGVLPGSDIRSIGACVFDMEKGEIGDHYYKACHNPRVFISGDPDNGESYGFKYDLKKDSKTEKWWSGVSLEAQSAFGNPVDLKEALEGFASFIHHHSNDVKHGQTRDVRLWSHGSAFDPPILEAACVAAGVTTPWFYRAPRDTRTWFDAAGVEDHTAFLKSFSAGTLHHALYDAVSQAQAICAANVLIHRK